MMVIKFFFKVADLDTNGIADEDEPFVDVCYVSDMLVNMITGDSQQLGILLRLYANVDAFTPWSFEIFVLGLDIILPKMREDNFKVIDHLGKNLI